MKQRIPAPGPKPARSRSALLAYTVAAAALLFALLSALRDITLDSELLAARELISRLHERINDQAHASSEQSARIADLFAADGEHHTVPGGEVVRRNARLYLAMRSLPTLAAGHVFQTWILARGTTAFTPSSTFTKNRQGSAIVQLPVNAAMIAEISLSIEPEGGSKTPTTTPLFTEKL
jgi:hypothetical protein